MHLNIKNDEAHRLATELARLTGESLTSVVTQALRERLGREQQRLGRSGVAAKLLNIGKRYSRLPDNSLEEPEDLYDENGLPR